MNQEPKKAIKRFFSAQKKLNQLGIIHSRDYLGDISRYLCQVIYGLEPAESGRHSGYDGMIGTAKVLVRYNNCPTGTPVRLSEPFEFDELIVVLGSNCFLRPDNMKDELVFYRFTREEVSEKFRTSGGSYSGGKPLFSQGYDKVLSL